MRRIVICATLLIAVFAGCGERDDDVYCLVVDGEVFYRGWHEVKVFHREGERFWWKVFNDPRQGIAQAKRVDVFKVPWNEDCVPDQLPEPGESE